MAVQGNTPSAGAIQFNSLNYLTSSDIIEMHAKAKIDINPRVFGRYGREKLGILPFIEEFGQKEAASSSVFSHYEQDFTREIILATGSAGSANGASVTYAVDSAYIRDYPGSADESSNLTNWLK